MEKLKYIIDEYGNFAIFSENNAHSDMAKGFEFKPVGAGFCDIAIGYTGKIKENGEEEKNINVHCFGESVSLKLESREEDEKIINEKI